MNKLKDIVLNPRKYRKLWVHILAVVIIVANIFLGDNNPVVNMVTVLADLVGIERLPNDAYTK